MLKPRLLFALGALPCLLSAQNLVPNGSFELGTAGYGIRTNLRFDTNPEQKFFPLETVADPAADGKQVLRIRNPHANRFELHSRQFPLKADTEYTFRFKIRSTAKNGQELFAVPYSVKNNWKGWMVRVKATDQWRNCEYKFKTGPKDGAPYFYHLQFRDVNNSDIPASDIYIDDIQLFETKSVPAKTVEFALNIADPLIVSDGKTPAVLTLKAGNFTDKPWQGTVTVGATEEFLGTRAEPQKFELRLSPGEVREIPVKWNLPYGAYCATAVAEGIGHSIPAYFAVAGKYEREKRDFDRDFCIGLNSGIGIVQNGEKPKIGTMAHNAAAEKKLEYLQKMGCRIIREHDAGVESTAWYLMEPEKGKWDYRHLDYSLKQFEKYGIEVLSCVGRIGFLRPANEQQKLWRTRSWPEWAEPFAHPAEHKSYNWDDCKGRVFLPDMKLWREYLHKLAVHAKGRIRYYEVFNEPNGVMSAEDYFPYMKAVYEEVKKVDPSAKILGLCITSDFGVSGDTFTKDVMALGGGKFMDIAAFHPYSGRELNSVNPADTYIANFRNSLGEYRGMPLWNTEIYYLYDTADKSLNQGICNPGHIAARYLTDLGENVIQSVSLSEGAVWSRNSLFPEGAESSDSWVDLIPNENFVVNNALARFFEAAKPLAKYRLPNGVIVYAFRKDGKPVAAIWHYQKRDGVKGDLSPFQVFDVYGNPVKPGVLPLTGTPYYLRPGTLSEAAFLEKLKTLSVLLDNPIGASPLVRLLNRDGEYSLLATLSNGSTADQTVIIGFSGNGFTGAKSVRAVVPAGKSADFELPLRKTSAKTEPVLRLYHNGRVLSVPVEVSECRAISLDGTKARPGFPFTWSMKKADGKLVLTVRVEDSTNSGADAAGRRPWEQDCLELFFDADPDTILPAHSRAYTPDTFRVFVLPRLAPEKQVETWFRDGCRFSRKDLECKVVSDPAGYTVTLALPLAKLGNRLGFDLKTDDALPGKTTSREFIWSENRNNHSDRTAFGVLELK